MNNKSFKSNKSEIEDKLLVFLDKNKIKLPLFQVIMGNFSTIKSIILRNSNKIDLEYITGQLMFVYKNIQKYDNLIVSYRIEGKSTEFFIIERENLLQTEKELYNKLLKVIEDNLIRAKELILYNTVQQNDNDVHILISDKTLHNIKGPSIYNNDYSTRIYYINGEKIDEQEWKKNPLVRTDIIRKLINNNKRTK